MDHIASLEGKISTYYNAPYAVYTLSCTHSMDLCLSYLNVNNLICPKNTSLNIPLLLMKKGISYTLDLVQWEKYYTLGNSKIIDAAVYWQQNGYIAGSLMCLSFQNRKHISAGGGGMILTDDMSEVLALRQLRDNAVSYMDQRTLDFYYKKAEQADLIFDQVRDITPKLVTYEHYKDVSSFVAKKAQFYLDSLDELSY